jgi:hypothetical protein
LDGATFANLNKLIMHNLVEFGSMNEVDVANKLVFFGTNGVIVFQGFKNGVNTNMMQNHVLIMNGVHYMAHYTKLDAQTLSNLSLVGKIKSLFTSMHNYFAHNVATLLLEEWEDDTHTPKMGTWESLRTLKTLEFYFRGQNTSH